MENKVVPVCRKSFAFSQTEPYLKWKRGLSPLFQAFFPLQPGFFLNQAAVFRQSQIGEQTNLFPDFLKKQTKQRNFKKFN